MAITWRTDYALRIMLEAARIDRRTTVRELSDASGVPYDFARSIARELARASLLVSRRGVNGGFELARGAEEITLHDVFAAMKEPASMALCTQCAHDCDRSGTCPFHGVVWRELDRRIAGYLSNFTIADAVLADVPSLSLS